MTNEKRKVIAIDATLADQLRIEAIKQKLTLRELTDKVIKQYLSNLTTK